jgi:hypothetical protein
MPPRRRLTVLAAVVALAAAPASALAQSAGDDQYEDPFAGENQSQPESSGGGQDPAPTPTPAPAEPAPAPAPAAESAPEPAAEAAQQPELPRTGLDAAPILAIGAVLLGSGVALRVRLRERS